MENLHNKGIKELNNFVTLFSKKKKLRKVI